MIKTWIYSLTFMATVFWVGWQISAKLDAQASAMLVGAAFTAMFAIVMVVVVAASMRSMAETKARLAEHALLVEYATRSEHKVAHRFLLENKEEVDA